MHPFAENLLHYAYALRVERASSEFHSHRPEKSFGIDIIAFVVCLKCNTLKDRGLRLPDRNPDRLVARCVGLPVFFAPAHPARFKLEIPGAPQASDSGFFEVPHEVCGAGKFREFIAAVNPFSALVHRECAPDFGHRSQFAGVHVELVARSGLSRRSFIPDFQPWGFGIFRFHVHLVAYFPARCSGK